MAGQTLSEIRSLLASAGLSPKHRFGQNFLIDLNLMRKVPEVAELVADDVVLEVGPGTGSLSEILLESGAKVIAAEIDRGFAALNRERLGEHPNFSLVEGDALASKHAINPEILEAIRSHEPGPTGHYKLIANLPYQIATPLMMDLMYITPKIHSMTCTIQKEVGERLEGKPGTAAYGPLSVVAQTLATVKNVFLLPAKVFWPPPKIESVLVHVVMRDAPPIVDGDVEGFVTLVRNAFLQRRKMLRRIAKSWSFSDPSRIFESAGISADLRPEQLSPADWQRLFAATKGLEPT